MYLAVQVNLDGVILSEFPNNRQLTCYTINAYKVSVSVVLCHVKVEY